MDEEIIRLGPEASRRFIEQVVEPSSVQDGKTYLERMREKANDARYLHRDPGDETDHREPILCGTNNWDEVDPASHVHLFKPSTGLCRCGASHEDFRRH